MKSLSFLPLAALATAFVIPDAETARSLQIQDVQSIWDKFPSSHELWDDWLNIQEQVKKTAGCAKQKINNAIDAAYETAVTYDDKFQTAFDGNAWLAQEEEDEDLVDRPPPHGPPHHGPPHDGPPHHGPPHKRPHHPPHHGKSNQTVYELIASSKYTTILAKLINDYPDLVDLLNGTKANYTVFAPTDRAFKKIPKGAPKPSKEQLKAILTYHVSPEFYPAGRILVTRTIPTALEAGYIGKVPQRVSTQVGFRGLTVNFYARVVAVNIFGTNGVIHGLDSILLPPPKAVEIINAFPGEFSTLELALYKTGLFETFNDTSSHNGGTLFAPSNFAFKRLGPKINAFLFSKYGLKYLKALLLYHVADDITLYSDAIYKSEEATSYPNHRIPKGLYHIDLPTGLEDKKLSVDIARYGRLITIKINAFTRVVVSDGIAADGVIHVIPNVLIPPKTPGAAPIIADDSLTVEEFKEALAPLFGETEQTYDWEL